MRLPIRVLKHVFFLSSVPSVGPGILEAYSINRSSVFVRWNKTGIPGDKWNGIPKGFRIHGTGNPCDGFVIGARDVALNVSSLILTGLKAWVNYEIKVSGITAPGHGTASVKRIKTNDSGMHLFLVKNLLKLLKSNL